jgi:hypothetical protein
MRYARPHAEIFSLSPNFDVFRHRTIGLCAPPQRSLNANVMGQRPKIPGNAGNA